MRASVASGHPVTTGAAVELLRAGGNAFDAVVAAGFASAVAEPVFTSLGGGGFLLARTGSGEATLFDFFVDTPGHGHPQADLEPHFVPVTVRFPGSEQVFNVGLGSAAVPGVLRGYLHAHARLGRRPLAEVVAPAVRAAREGVPLSARQAYFFRLLEPILTLTDGAARLFTRDGRLLAEGERYANPDLAAFLEELPAGAESLHGGELARRVAADMDRGDGLLTEADLAAYRVRERVPLGAVYRGHVLLTNPPPSFGGWGLAASLALLEAQEPASQALAPERLRALVAVMEEVDRLRAAGGGSAAGEEGAAGRVRRFARGTTHVSVCDAEGNAASMSTSNGEGSGYVIPGTGIFLNNMMGEDDLHPEGFFATPPGRRVLSGMSPSLLLHEGRVRVALGSGGSKRIRTALLQVVSAVVDHGLPLPEAVALPRVHWDGAVAQLEPGFPEASVAALRRDRPVNVWTCTDLYFGGVHAASPTGTAAGDPRRGGSAFP